MAKLSAEQKKFEIERASSAVRTVYEAGHEKSWTAEELGKILTASLGTDGSAESEGDNITASQWVLEGLIKCKAMTQNDDGSGQLTEEAVFQYNNKSNFFAIKAPVGTIKVRQGAVVTLF